MSDRLRIVHVVGARPNFMKIAPILDACREVDGFENLLVHTGQHYDDRMSDLFFRQLGIPEPDLFLGVGSGTHARQTARILEAFETVVEDHRPDLVVVVGDVNSTLACSLVAVKAGVPVAHVEAGLRSNDRTMPEEINRIVTDSISDLLFATEQSGVDNLAREGVPAGRVHLVGNVMIDTLLKHRASAMESGVLGELGLDDGSYAVVTMHRPSNVDDPSHLRDVLLPIVELSRKMPVAFPVHPRTAGRLAGVLEDISDASGVRLLDPLGYLDFLRLMIGARVVVTDSGGIQEETTVLGVPCVTVRENTERPITLTHGTNHLAGIRPDGIRAALEDALGGARAVTGPPPLWDGNAAGRIVDVLRAWRGR